jgi:hypothetical protein
VIRQAFGPDKRMPYWSLGMGAGEHHCYRLDIDPGETENRLGSTDEADMIELLRVALKAIDAPDEQFARLGIA